MERADRDENLSWRAASVIMALATFLTLASRFLGIDPFTDVFDLFIVYLPAAVLVGTLLFLWLKRRRERTADLTSDRLNPENTVV